MSPSLAAVLAASGGTPIDPSNPSDPSGDVGTQGPIGLALIVLLLVAVVLLVRSMTKHLKRIPASFDPEDQLPPVPDTPAELLAAGERASAERRPGEDLLEQLRRAPRAIEPPRPRSDDRSDTPAQE